MKLLGELWWNIRGNFNIKHSSINGKAADTLLGLYKSSERSFKIIFMFKQGRVVVGTVLGAFLTALPKLLSSLFSVFLCSSNLALGKIICSNIYNIPLTTGVYGLVGGLEIKNSAIAKNAYSFSISLSEVLLTAPFTVIASLLFALNKLSNNISRPWGVMMFAQPV